MLGNHPIIIENKMTLLYSQRLHRPQDHCRGFYIDPSSIHRFFHNDPSFHNTDSLPIPIKPPNQVNHRRFSMKDFGICGKVGLGKQANSIGSLFLRDLRSFIEISSYENPLRDPFVVEYFPGLGGRFILADGFHRLAECIRRGYKGWVYAILKEGYIDETNRFPCFKKSVQYVIDDIIE